VLWSRRRGGGTGQHRSPALAGPVPLLRGAGSRRGGRPASPMPPRPSSFSKSAYEQSPGECARKRVIDEVAAAEKEEDDEEKEEEKAMAAVEGHNDVSEGEDDAFDEQEPELDSVESEKRRVARFLLAQLVAVRDRILPHERDAPRPAAPPRPTTPAQPVPVSVAKPSKPVPPAVRPRAPLLARHSAVPLSAAHQVSAEPRAVSSRAPLRPRPVRVVQALQTTVMGFVPVAVAAPQPQLPPLPLGSRRMR
jgi:hypothetical protein